MYAHVVNIMVLILIPMVIIHINGHAFSLSKSTYIRIVVADDSYLETLLISGRNVCLFSVFDTFHEIMELRSSEHVV